MAGEVTIIADDHEQREMGRDRGDSDACGTRIIEPNGVSMANKIDYFEIGSPDPDSSKAFYGGLFGWKIGPPSAPAQYSMIDEDQGGLWDTSALGGKNWAIFYVHVEDVQASIDQAQDLGASVAVPLTDNGAIEFAHLVDPLGNRFGIWRPKSS